MKEINRAIKCTVHDCTYNERNYNYCTLDRVKICLCNPEDEKESTMCDSYQCKPKPKKSRR